MSVSREQRWAGLCVLGPWSRTLPLMEAAHRLHSHSSAAATSAVKILRGHEMVDYQGVLDVVFHPTQPWVFTAGADATICLFVNP